MVICSPLWQSFLCEEMRFSYVHNKIKILCFQNFREDSSAAAPSQRMASLFATTINALILYIVYVITIKVTRMPEICIRCVKDVKIGSSIFPSEQISATFTKHKQDCHSISNFNCEYLSI